MRKLKTDNKDKSSSIIFRALDGQGHALYEFFFSDRSSLYLFKIDIERKEWLRPGDSGYDESPLKTISELKELGLVDGEFAPYREYTVSPEAFQEYTDEISCTSTKTLVKRLDVDGIIREFEGNGFDVSREAIMHNFYAWLADMKSGYRGRGYHLFTACGCNPLRFTATELYPACEDWQKTYEC